MLYFVYGKKREEARRRAHQLVGLMLKKRPGAEVFRTSGDAFNAGRFDELIEGRTLFEAKHIVFADSLFENEEIKELVLERLQALRDSENAFVLLEGSVDKATLQKIEKVAEKVEVFDEKKEKMGEKKGFNIFDMATALGERDKKKLWMLYQRALHEGVSPEEISGILFWQVRSMATASSSSNASEAELSPFVYTKAKSFLRNYSMKEIQALSTALISLYHDAHRGVHAYDLALERFILGV